jgi:hypothetical protein
MFVHVDKLIISMFLQYQFSVYQDPSRLYNNHTKKCLHFNHLTLLHHVSSHKVTTLVLFCITLFDSLMMLFCGPKHVGMLNVILQYKYLRSKLVHLVGLVS